jgi:hypothetical protein
MLPFPARAPFRIDQVTAAPLGLALLSLALVAAAVLMTVAEHTGRRRLWCGTALLMPALATLLFGLASWGTSDVTKLSHFLAFDASRVRGEPFWSLAAPLIVRFPYRMALVHGLVAAGYATLPILLALRWQARAWAGWWALLVLFSPLLRNFLQNGVSRQALMTVLLVPLLLWAGRLAPVRRTPLAVATLTAAAVHTSFAGTAVLALAPRVLAAAASGGQPGRLAAPGRRQRRLLLSGALGLALLALLAWAAPMVWLKLQSYTQQESFFSRYALALPVARLQLAMAIGVVLVCWRRRLGWRQLLACGHSRQLAFFALLFMLIQQCLRQGWVPPLTSRFADAVGLFLLIAWLAWLERHRARWAVLPTLLVSLDYWLLERLPEGLTLHCGRDDAFFCVPDRWPWQVRWGSGP